MTAQSIVLMDQDFVVAYAYEFGYSNYCEHAGSSPGPGVNPPGKPLPGKPIVLYQGRPQRSFPGK